MYMYIYIYIYIYIYVQSPEEPVGKDRWILETPCIRWIQRIESPDGRCRRPEPNHVPSLTPDIDSQPPHHRFTPANVRSHEAIA